MAWWKKAEKPEDVEGCESGAAAGSGAHGGATAIGAGL